MDNALNRRRFLQRATVAGAGLLTLPSWVSASSLTTEHLVSVQMGPHSLFDEGIPQVLDFLQQKAAMNSVMVYSHTYYGG